MKKSDSMRKMLILREKELIDAATNDEAVAEKRSQTSVIELHILASLLPENKEAANIVRQLYRDGAPDLGHAFEAAFEQLAVGDVFHNRESNARDLVALYHSLSVCAENPTGNEEGLQYIRGELGLLADRLTQDAEENPSEKASLTNEIHALQEYQNIIADNPRHVKYIALTGTILRNWEHLKNYTHTFRLLVVVARNQKGIRNDEESRYAFVRMLKDVSRKWRS